MKNVIAGTAGHVDHGKTTLIHVLTGIDTDRLEEEKRRGISIDLGFAHWEAGDIQFGFVDVPGHERFVRNMLAGAAGIDLVILVIAADESVKPQTREHFEICRLLGIRHGMVVLTKADLPDDETLELARQEVAELVAGSFLEGAPVVAVSNITGSGFDSFQKELTRLGEQAAGRDATGLVRLPVDRSFSMRGFGTVVTGTTISGRVSAGDEVEVYPTGTRLRVRGVQVHGESVKAASAGQRTAVNLAGVEAEDLRRGMTLGPPELLRATTVVDTRFELLVGAPPLKHRAPVHFHAGTAEVEASVRLLDAAETLRPGARGALVRFLLAEPLLLLPGDRFIVRMFSPVATIGGGIVEDNQPPLRLRRGAAAARLRAFAEKPLATLVAEHPQGISIQSVVARLGAPAERIASEARANGIQQTGELLIAREALEKAVANLRQAVKAFHEAHPLLPGMNRAQAPVPAELMEAVLSADAGVVADGEILRLASHRIALKTEEDAAAGKMEQLFQAGGLAVPASDDVLRQAGVDAGRARTLLQMLVRQGKLIRVGPDLIFHATALARLRMILAERRGQRFSVAEFKEWTGVSRKFAIPLLEYLDRERITRREGDRRLVL